ncbi:LamG domain-containing protein [Labilibaculum antarcticum]|nr:LamG domain-containing protein [Labilibaculum antarcticum]
MKRYNLFMFLILSICLFACATIGGKKVTTKNVISSSEAYKGLEGVVCAWDFKGDEPLKSKVGEPYSLTLANELINVSAIEGETCLSIKEGGYAVIPRADCPALNFSGKHSTFSILARINRKDKAYKQCETIAGMWNETGKKRQYCMFINLLQKNSANQVCGHVSDVGGPTPGHKWARDASIGSTPVEFDKWTSIAITFNGESVKSYFNGKLDYREGLNPYAYSHELYDGGEIGSDFTIAAVDRLEEMGNFFVGGISHLVVFNRALSDEEIATFNF